MTAGAYLACEVHGRLVRRDAWPYCEGPVLVCVGFDGEAAGWCTAGPVPEVSWARLLAGEKYWPGVIVALDPSQASDYPGSMTQTPGDKSKDIELAPGEYRSPRTGVIMGHRAEPGIPRFGADEAFGLYGSGSHPDGGQYGPADITEYDQSRPDIEGT